MENPEEILHSLEEFSKLRPKSIPRELEEYLCFVAKTGDPVYQWSVIKCLFREKLINVITEFYESCPSVSIPSCRNVDIFNYDTMKTFILEKLDTFVAAPFTVQRICELLTTPRKEYNRIDKYMRALEKNILVVSTTEPGNHRTPENGDGLINGIESDHVQDGSHDINIEEMDDAPIWPSKSEESYQSTSKEDPSLVEKMYSERDSNLEPEAATSQAQPLETVICSPSDDQTFIPIAISSAEECEVNSVLDNEKPDAQETELQVANEETEAIPAIVQRRRTSIEPPSDHCEDTQLPMPSDEDDKAIILPLEPEIELEKTELTLELPDSEHLPQAGDTLKEDAMENKTKEESRSESEDALEPTDCGDNSHGIINAVAGDNLELTEQVEIDVTSIANSNSKEENAIPSEMHKYAEPALETPEQALLMEDQNQEKEELPQAETPIDIVASEPTVVDEESPSPSSGEPMAVSEMSHSPTIPIAALEADQTVPVLVRAESTSEEVTTPPLPFSEQQIVVETPEQPDLAVELQPEIVENPPPPPPPPADQLLKTETSMEVDVVEASPTSECAPSDATDSADSNN